MDGSPVLRQQSQNTIRSDVLIVKSEQNKVTFNSKSSKALPQHPLQHDLENQDPLYLGQGHVRLGVSRLPVLAKSLHLQTSKEFTQSHSKWEEKPLAGKARPKKPCTRPVPFNLSQPKSTRVVSENQHPNLPTRTNKINKNVCSSQIKTSNRNVKHSRTLHENVKFINSSEKTLQPLGQSRHSCKTLANVSSPVLSAPNSQKNCPAAPEKPSAETCAKSMNMLSLKDAPSISKKDNFQQDHAALLSILRNEGVTSTMTSQSKPYNYLPQRVSILKCQQKSEPNAGSIKSVTFSPDHEALQSILKNEGTKAWAPADRGSSIYTPMRVSVKKKVVQTRTGVMGSFVKAVQFSPDAAALQSILQNEGVKTIHPDAATPRNSVCPAGRSSSIYTAQRVLVKKNPAQPSPGQCGLAARKQTPMNKWTPQRVTRQQPKSATKWHTSQTSPYGFTAGFRNCKANLCPKEEVVQKLFDEEEEENTEDVTLPQTELPPDQITNEGEIQSAKGVDGLLKDEEQKDKEQIEGPFIQNPERQSVIFFSTGKKLLREPRFKKPEMSDHIQHNPVNTLPVLQQSRPISAIVVNVAKDLLTQTDGINPAMAVLQKRRLLLEELRLDEEVATYTSVPVQNVSGFLPPRPRCGNPVATTLHFEESTRFVPISLEMSPVSHFSS